jgi:cobalamin transport system ATP-binding protein
MKTWMSRWTRWNSFKSPIWLRGPSEKFRAAQQTEILLLDEATSNLDVARKIQVFDLLAAKNLRGSTVLCVMHDLNLAALYCRRLIFLKNGRVAADGKTEDVFNDRNLSEIYETEIKVSRHPVTGSPQAHFVPSHNSGNGGSHVLSRSGSGVRD